MKIAGRITGALFMVGALVVYWMALAYGVGAGVEMHKCRSVRLLVTSGGMFATGLIALAVFE